MNRYLSLAAAETQSKASMSDYWHSVIPAAGKSSAGFRRRFRLFLRVMTLSALLPLAATPSLADGPCISFKYESGYVGGAVYEVWAHAQPWACPLGLCWSKLVKDGSEPQPVYCPAFPKRVLGVDGIVTINISVKSAGPAYPVIVSQHCDKPNNISSAQEGQMLYSRDCVLR